ncbi:MAG: NAD-dependent epimerase/dehydratase family protein [Fimbriimonadaceae bacterium]
MRILVIGGRSFVGRHFVEAALAHGHEVTLLNRGKKNPELFTHLDSIRGDRSEIAELVAGRSWDAVFDSCGYLPSLVEKSAKALKGNAGQYVFISTISVYPLGPTPGPDENSERLKLQVPGEELTGETYGPLKALCEDAVWSEFGDGATVLRPGLIIGPHDPTDRFTYWVERCAQRRPFVAPARASQPLQLLDARDLGEFALRVVEQERPDVFNVAGPEAGTDFGSVIDLAGDQFGNVAEPLWLSPDQLQEAELDLWNDLPLSAPLDGSQDGLMAASISKALQNELELRPLEESIRDIQDWRVSLPAEPMKTGLTEERQSELIDRYG